MTQPGQSYTFTPFYRSCFFVPTDDQGNVNGQEMYAAVEFEEPFVVSAGLRPNVNEARVSYQELAAIGYGNSGASPTSQMSLYGQLQFFFTAPAATVGGSDNQTDGSDSPLSPFSGHAKPVLTINDVSIVELTPSREGQPVNGTNPDGSPKFDVMQVVEWRVSFADFRMRFVAPRGGCLRYGVVNPSSSQPVGTTDSDDSGSNNSSSSGSSGSTPSGPTSQSSPAPQYKISDLMNMCIQAMGFTGSKVPTPPSAVDNVDPPLDLQWHNSHAPSELQKLLDLAGAVFCPHMDGTASIEMLGGGTALPNLQAQSSGQAPANGQLLRTTDMGPIDLRGKIVVFSSAPQPALVTETITGPSGETWQFVVQDTDDSWVPWDSEPAVMQGYDPVELIQQNFAQLYPQGQSPPPEVLRLQRQLYHCIQLDASNYPPQLQPITRKRYESLTQIGDPQITAKVAVLGYTAAGAAYVIMASNAVDVGAVQVIDGCVLYTDQLLGKVAQSGDSNEEDYYAQFAELSNGDLSVRFTHEQLDSNQQPVYYQMGFQGKWHQHADKTPIRQRHSNQCDQRGRQRYDLYPPSRVEVAHGAASYGKFAEHKSFESNRLRQQGASAGRELSAKQPAAGAAPACPWILQPEHHRHSERGGDRSEGMPDDFTGEPLVAAGGFELSPMASGDGVAGPA